MRKVIILLISGYVFAAITGCFLEGLFDNDTNSGVDSVQFTVLGKCISEKKCACPCDCEKIVDAIQNMDKNSGDCTEDVKYNNAGAAKPSDVIFDIDAVCTGNGSGAQCQCQCICTFELQ
jgi:hypothetical protein